MIVCANRAETPRLLLMSANARFLQDRGAEILEAAGALRVTKAPVTEQTSSVHLLGTCRMGNDPPTSVIDKYHRSHDVANLFLCDGSSLVTSGPGAADDDHSGARVLRG